MLYKQVTPKLQTLGLKFLEGILFTGLKIHAAACKSGFLKTKKKTKKTNKKT